MNAEEVRQVKGRGLNEYASSPSSPIAPSSFSTASASTSDSTSHKPTLLPGSIVTEVDPQTGFTQNFTCGRCLGEGGFGRCIEVSDGTNSYALKAVSRSILQKPKNFEKLCTEIAIHRRMKHKHIVNFIRSFHDKYYVYMLLEKCQYGTVRDLMKVRPMKVDEAQYVLLQCLSAVQYMHRNNVIHRDLKPGNIMLDGNLSVKIGDFGLATEMKFDGERKRTMCGTPNYMAPEIIEQHRDGHSFEVDTWSLGVILYTVLVGEPPFQMSNVPLTYKRIRQGNVEFPPHLSIYAKSLILSMLSTSPEKRPTLIEVRSHPFFVNPPHPMNTPVSLYAVALSEQRRKLAKANAAAHRASAPPAIAAVPQSSKPTDPSSAPLAVASENVSSNVPLKPHLERGKADNNSEEVVLFAVRNPNSIRGNERGTVQRSNSALFHVYRDAARPSSSARKRVPGGVGSPTAAGSDASPPPLVGGGGGTSSSSAPGHMPPPPPTSPPSSRHAEADGSGRDGREGHHHALPSKAQPLSRPSSGTTTGNVPQRSARTHSARPPGNPTPSRRQSSHGVGAGGLLPPSHAIPPAVPVGNRLMHTMGRRGRYPQMDHASEEGGGGVGYEEEEEEPPQFRPGTNGGIPPPPSSSSSSPPPPEAGGPTGRRRPSGTATAALRLLGAADPSSAVHSPRPSSPILVRRGAPTPMMAAALPPTSVRRRSGSGEREGSSRGSSSSGGGGGSPAQLLGGGPRASTVRGAAGNAEGRRAGLLTSMRSPLRQRPSTHPSAPALFSTVDIESGEERRRGGAGKRNEGGRAVSPPLPPSSSSSTSSSSSSSSLSFYPHASKKKVALPSDEAGKRVSQKEPMAVSRRTRAGEKEEEKKNARVSRAMLSPPLLQPLVWVRCAIDFTCKYGFCFLLSNGVVGALFNDDTKLFWDLSSDQVLYTVRVVQPANNTTTTTGGGGAAVKKGSSGEDAPPKRYASDSPSWFPMRSYPETLQKKITLIKYFERAFVTVGGHYSDKVKRCSKFYSSHDGAGGSLVPSYDGGEGRGAVARLPAPLEGDVRATPSDGAPALPLPGEKNYVYLKGWVVVDGATVFRFSNQMVQICLSDGSEMFFFWLLELVTHRHPGSGPHHPPIQRTLRITEAVKDEKLLAGLTIVRKAYSNLSTF